MISKFNTLMEFLEFMSEATGADICIHDFSGILSNAHLSIDYKYSIHSAQFCTIAKSTSKGFKLCQKCKTLANNTAVSKKQLFCGYCSNGMFEITLPVCINQTPVCILYIGNITFDKELTFKKIEKMCRHTGVDPSALKLEAQHSAAAHPPEYYIKAAELISSYILLFLETSTNNIVPTTSKSWVIKSILEYISYNYDKNLTLKSMSELYFMNEKYLGRLFSKEFGTSFHQHLNLVRLRRATELLETTQKSIISISSECGFTDVTYFNRIFKKEFSLTPTEYRKKYAKT